MTAVLMMVPQFVLSLDISAATDDGYVLRNSGRESWKVTALRNSTPKYSGAGIAMGDDSRDTRNGQTAKQSGTLTNC
jgi:hypothetical protein